MRTTIQFFITFCLLLSQYVIAAQDEAPPYHVKSIYFGGGSYYIDQQQLEELYQFLDQFNPIEEYEIAIQSHTDNIGSLEYNQRLATLRGDAVKQEIITHGVPSELLINQDFGEQAPVFDNTTWDGKLRNRRVDVIIRRIVF
jgi:outer membrane protein OmpA-like peptidoglycan-associated protein